MCYKVDCPTCKNTTWSGCGNHVPTAFNGIPEPSRCTCVPQIERNGEMYPPQAGKGHASDKTGAVKAGQGPEFNTVVGGNS
ncbi:hypothetical protein BJ878DRAFT_509340 [Calycina marina]|uniref:Uncharacterized protein n=1 Tax=Calycina marina TaxID=1763456 RepID=A0A9P8CFV1_9HELO|nr:hypothetical protein BJ878DRAFT_509340 [Calycina marina]